MQLIPSRCYSTQVIKRDARAICLVTCLVSLSLGTGCNLLATFPDAEAENTQALCQDGRDNDFDGASDCQDPDCVSSCVELQGLDLEQVCLQIAPWGTRQSPSPTAAIVGRPGAALPNSVVYIYEDGGAESALRTVSVASDGSFSAALPSPSGPRPSMYLIANVPSEIILSSIARNAARTIRCVDWTASLVGREPGLDFTNPNRLALAPTSSPSLLPQFEETEPSASELAAVSRGTGAASASGAFRWRAQSSSVKPASRFYGAMAFDAVRGEVVMLGGITGVTSAAETWAWRQDHWVLIPNTDAPNTAAGALVPDPASDGLLYVGGLSNLQDNSAELLQTQWRWNGERWRVDDRGGLPLPAVRNLAAAYDERRGRVVAFGGCADFSEVLGLTCSSVLDGTWEYDGLDWTRRFIQGEVPPDRYGAVMAYDRPSNRVLMYGGFSVDGRALGDFWAFDGNRWERLPSAAGPGTRAFPAAAFDASEGRFALFGGVTNVDGAYVVDPRVWEWDGSTWTGLSSADRGPRARLGMATAYDPMSKALVVFGGTSEVERSDQTFLWSDRAWTEALPSARIHPRPNMAAAAAYHEQADAVFLFGGLEDRDDSQLILSGDLWTLSGRSWNRIPQTGPPARAFHRMSYDPTQGRLLVFGGLTSLNARTNDLWSWSVEQGWLQLAESALDRVHVKRPPWPSTESETSSSSSAVAWAQTRWQAIPGSTTTPAAGASINRAAAPSRERRAGWCSTTTAEL